MKQIKLEPRVGTHTHVPAVDGDDCVRVSRGTRSETVAGAVASCGCHTGRLRNNINHSSFCDVSVFVPFSHLAIRLTAPRARVLVVGNQLAPLLSQQPDINSLPEGLGGYAFQEQLGTGNSSKTSCSRVMRMAPLWSKCT